MVVKLPDRLHNVLENTASKKLGDCLQVQVIIRIQYLITPLL